MQNETLSRSLQVLMQGMGGTLLTMLLLTALTLILRSWRGRPESDDEG